VALDTAWVALSLLRHVGSKTLRALVAEFGSAEAVLKATERELLAVRGVGAKIASAIQQIDLSHVEAQIAQWQAQGVQLLPRDHPLYPPPLLHIDDEPPTLFVRGQWPLPWEKSAAIVGTRRPTPDAQQTALQLGQRLAAAGWLVVSGMALGIDAAAHQGVLQAAQGHTVAVWGSGVLHLYPPQHAALAAQIAARGAILSENAPDADATAPRLVSRNRLISGLCQQVIVVETDATGGAMYAAKAARAQGKTLYAVGYPASGNLQLLRDGAHYLAPDLGDFSL